MQNAPLLKQLLILDTYAVRRGSLEPGQIPAPRSIVTPWRPRRQCPRASSPQLAQTAHRRKQPWRRGTCTLRGKASRLAVALVTHHPREPATTRLRPWSEMPRPRGSTRWWCEAQNPLCSQPFPRTHQNAPMKVRLLPSPIDPGSSPHPEPLLFGTHNMPPVPGEALGESFGPAGSLMVRDRARPPTALRSFVI